MFSKRKSPVVAGVDGQLVREIDERVRESVRRRVTGMAATFEAMTPGWQEHLEKDAAYILEGARIRGAQQRVAKGVELGADRRLRFQVSSLFLQDSHRLLTGDPNGNERLHLVSGTVSPDGVKILSRIVAVPTDKASPAYVRADPQATHAILVKLVEEDGHLPLGMWHSHIMNGADSTRPSGVDLANQDRFCTIGWDEVIGGIFSLDGFFRAFSTARDFSLDVYGKGAEVVSEGPRETIIKITPGGVS